VLGGGKSFQPTLYALALEQLFPGAKVEGGRLFYCTKVGEFGEVSVPLGTTAREAARKAIGIIGEALERGFLPAAPAKDECTYCDYRTVCGDREEQRVARKTKADLQALQTLREMK
jgi:CRISPR/Cas system-associated exonuclease Cas4 (RecB family)